MTLTAKRLREVLRYNARTGDFSWTRARPQKAGARAGCVGAEGYIVIRIDKHTYYGHRLAWLYMRGAWPHPITDHINGDRSDNRWCNLRETSYSGNSRNRRLDRRNTSGFKGVSLDKSTGRWRAQLSCLFDTKPQAIAAYRGAAVAFGVGEFLRP